MNSDALLRALRSGGLTIAARRTGKTRALCMLAQEFGHSAVIVVPNRHFRAIVEQTWNELFHFRYPMPPVVWPVATSLGGQRLIGNGRTRVVSSRYGSMYAEADLGTAPVLLVDEWFQAKWNGNFFAAIGTPPFPVRIKAGVADSISEDDLEATRRELAPGTFANEMLCQWLELE